MARKNKKRMKALNKAMAVLLIVGGLSLGIGAWTSFNFIEWISFGMAWLSKTLYTLIGLSALVGGYRLFK